MGDIDGIVDVDDAQDAGDSSGAHDVGGEDSPRTPMMLAMKTVSAMALRRKYVPRWGMVAQKPRRYEDDRREDSVKDIWSKRFEEDRG